MSTRELTIEALEAMIAYETSRLKQAMRRFALKLEKEADLLDEGHHPASLGYVSSDTQSAEIDRLAITIRAYTATLSALKSVDEKSKDDTKSAGKKSKRAKV